MELKELLGEELYEQVDAKIQEHNAGEEDKLKHVRYTDLSEGNYVSKDKYASMETKAGGLEAQLGEADKTIKSYEKMDIEGIQQSVKNWESKYNTDTQDLQKKLDDQQKQFAAEKFMDGQRIKSPLSKKSIMRDFLSQGFELKEGQFVGGEEYMEKIKEQYPEEFEEKEDKPAKKFVRGTARTHRPQTKSEQEAYLANKYGKNKYYNQ